MHFHHSPASTNAYVFIEKVTVVYFVDLDALFRDNNDALQERTFSRISGREQLRISACPFPGLALLGDCLSLYCHNYGKP
ncbi:hypothetical protein HN873_050085 [Arachis hypogaea]